MSAAQRITLTIDADKVTPQTTPKNDLYQGDKNANEIEIELVRGGVPVALNGYTAAGSMERSDGNQVPCTGRIEGGKIIITLNEHCYVYAGPYKLDIELSGGGEELRRTIAQITGTVKKTASGPIVEVEEEIVDVDAVIALYGEMKTAKNEAEKAATEANSAAGAANTAAAAANSAARSAEEATTAASNAAQAATTAAGQANTAAGSATNAAGAANQAAGRAENVASKSPYIGDNGNWYVYDVDAGEYVDSGRPSRGATGAVEGLDYYEGNPSALGTASPGESNEVARGDHVHPMPTAGDVGALPVEGTAADASKLGGKESSYYLNLANVVPDGAGAHNATYRGKDLGTAVTAEQYAAIADGTFRDLFIGDYWTIGGVVYRIAAFDYYYKTGDTACTTHHVTLVPDSAMYNHAMNDTNVTTGAYVGSKMYTERLNQAKTTINNAFGSAHILNHRQFLQNAVTNGYASGGSWYDSTVELMTEQNVYGGKVFSNVSCGTALPNSNTVDKSQFPLFAFRPDLIGNREWFWLRDVVSAANFAYVYGYGFSGYNNASAAGGVRPAFSIVG